MIEPELPPKEIINKILREINMNDKDLEDGIVYLKEWLKKQPHLPKSADDITLKAFIIGCKSIERAKSKLDAYYSARVRFDKPFFNDRDPTKLKWSEGQKLMILPGFTPDGCKVIMFTLPLKEGVPEFQNEDTFRSVLMWYDMYIKRYYMNAGVYVLCDMYNLCVELTLKSSLTLSSQFSKIYQECYPIRLKGFISFNSPSLAEPFFNTFIRPFFAPKLRERMYLTADDHKSVVKYNIPLEMLPSDYEGGKSEPSNVLFEKDRKYIESMKDWFLREGSEKSFEDFRPKEDNNEMKGTFRKIEAD